MHDRNLFNRLHLLFFSVAATLLVGQPSFVSADGAVNMTVTPSNGHNLSVPKKHVRGGAPNACGAGPWNGYALLPPRSVELKFNHSTYPDRVTDLKAVSYSACPGECRPICNLGRPVSSFTALENQPISQFDSTYILAGSAIRSSIENPPSVTVPNLPFPITGTLCCCKCGEIPSMLQSPKNKRNPRNLTIPQIQRPTER